MADDAGFTPIEDIEAYVDVLIATIDNGDEATATTMAEDLFSGDPTNQHRNFELLNQAIAGIGHTSTFDNQKSHVAREKRAAQQRTLDAVLRLTLEKIQERRQAIMGRLAEIGIEMARLEEEMRVIELRLEEISTRMTTLQTRVATNLDEIKVLEHKFDDKFEIFDSTFIAHHGQAAMDNFKTEVLNVLKDYTTIHFTVESSDQPLRMHMIWQDENGEYFIRDPENDQHITLEGDDLLKLQGALAKGLKVAQVGNAEDEAAFARSAAGYSTYFGYLNTPTHFPIPTVRNEMLEYKEHIQILEGHIVVDQQELSKLGQERVGLERQLEEARHSHSALKEEQARLKRELEQLDRDIKALDHRITQRTEAISDFANLSYDEIDKLLDRLHGRLATETEDKDKIENNVASVEKIYSPIDDRSRDQVLADRNQRLGEAFGYNSIERFIGKFLPESAMRLLANAELKTAWNNPIMHNGHAVYRDNETLELYYFDKETGRTDTIDSLVKSQLLARSEGHPPELFWNETHKSQDPDNTYQDTYDNMELSAIAILESAQGTVTQQQGKIDNTCAEIKKTEQAIEQRTGLSATTREAMCAVVPPSTEGHPTKSAAPWKTSLSAKTEFSKEAPAPKIPDFTAGESGPDVDKAPLDMGLGQGAGKI